MAELKENIRYHLKKHHLGRDNAITVRDLAVELWPIRTNDREIRLAIRDLNKEKIPIISTIHPPYGFYYANEEGEIDEYVANLLARTRAMLSRVADINKIKAEEFIKGQLELFG